MTEPNATRADIRREIRKRRLAITPELRAQHSRQAAATIASHQIFKRSRNIAIYLANDGEIDPAPLAAIARRCDKNLFLPVLAPNRANRLDFAPYHPHSLLRANRFGIAEPVVSRSQMISIHTLDLVLTPLVSFDNNGNRLGMGGGFYDRSFAFLHHRRHWQKPRLLGFAFACQQINTLPHQEWDVPLAGIATEQGVALFD
ncbi:5-formyltetrahydrofolate cyclo-ligase [Solemya pervernicosa gill symbiont]|uniref:5-formyltetrahydrofolate cyclo-ligase n=2 Tax=Gammaproteobacteria incertae sedis TaxID=118884 RepID=A0A1T2L319_9GAMM|nr:5-formyltetrahydrofolate cyclo-ligase [Candidatus Reidiella endopervernicosa]OOZ39495.1 5-formyltetrahydrofolate cyclo-ligase [Solemya pervernicosa gill symbiont]QKQ25881.1 5-formyltetrahydrofolate cyclo-ligase [Candidatus Reidiella endopervernicosa]